MAIGPIELQGTVLRTQDYTQLKHQEDTRGVVDQSHFQDQLKKEVDDRSYQVSSKERAENQMKKFDAKEKGSNEYHHQDGNRKKKKDEMPEQGRVVLKHPGGFDVSI